MSDERSRQFIVLMSKQEREMLTELAQRRGVSAAAFTRWMLYVAAEEAGLISPLTPMHPKQNTDQVVV